MNLSFYALYSFLKSKLKNKFTMKAKKILVGVACLSVLATTTEVIAQGAKVAREMREYINATEDYKMEVIEEKVYDVETDSYMAMPSVKIVPKDDKKEYKPREIGGQKVNDANSVIYKAFHQHPEWKNVSIVADWTGSMYAYVGQIMRWHKLNMDRKLVKHMVLFNDGNDNKRQSSRKIVGSTGGIYYADPHDLDDLLAKVEQAVDNGDGGDAEENDLEAVLAAIDRYNTKEVVLIADNTSVRDMELLSGVNKPVHVILCNGGWVQDYIEIAYRTGGSITTINDELDFSDKRGMDPNNIVFNGLRYKIKTWTQQGQGQIVDKS